MRERIAELQLQEKEQRALLEIAQAVSAHLERDRLFAAVADAVRSVVSFDRMAIVLPSSEKDELLLYAWETEKGKPYWRPGVTFPREGTVPGWVLEHTRPYIGSSLEDLNSFPFSRGIASSEGMQSSCVLPLLVEERAVGVLGFLAREQGQYKSADLPLLEEMAAVVTGKSQIVFALDKGRYNESQGSHHRHVEQKRVPRYSRIGRVVGLFARSFRDHRDGGPDRA